MGGLKRNITYVYSGVESDLIDQIRNGTLKPHECILSENEISRKYNISRRSSRKALDNLVEKGLLYRMAGKGTFVADPKDNPSISSVCQFTFSFIVPDIDDIFISEICKGLQEAANSANCNLIIQSSNGSVEKENINIEYSLQHHVDGAVIFPNWGKANIDVIYKLKELKIPFVLIDRYFKDFDTDYVVVDNRKGAFEITAHLIRLGHKKIAHLYGTEGSANDERLEGYRDALASASIVYRPEYVKRINMEIHLNGNDRFEPDRQGGYENMRQLLALQDPPTAVFAGNDYQAIGAMQAIKNAGFKVPADVSVAGFDDLKFSSLLETPLTTVRQPKKEIGSKAFEILLDKVRGKSQEKTAKIVLDTEIIIRDSCAEIK
ncbi:MAG: GntR family transcriptional regulator [Victivallaceae bacterium]|nr:GntR family transcriptional regulator [Victivallaceae bacterium]